MVRRFASLFASLKARPEIAIILLLGMVLILTGGIFVLLGWPYRAAVVSGIGGSLLAAAVVSALNPLNDASFQEFSALGVKRSYLHRTGVAGDQWCKWLRGAKLHCTLLGIAHHKWCEEADFPDALHDALRRGVRVKFLFLDPTSEAAKQRVREDTRAARNTIQEIQGSIRFIWDLTRELRPEIRDNLKLYVYNATPSSGTNWFDNFMIVAHYLAGFPNVTSPALLVEPVATEPGSKCLYDIYMENVNKVEGRFSTLIDDHWMREHFPEEA